MTDTVIERKEVPDWITKQVNRIGGLNQFGRGNFRVIWGSNRTHIVGGKFKKVVMVKSDEHLIIPDRAVVTEVPEIRELLKYHPFRWHLERYRGPEFYGSREEWYEQTYDAECGFHTQGDYPSEGDYEHIFYLAMCPHMKPGDQEWCGPCTLTSGQYIPLEENFNLIEIMIQAFQRSDEVSKQAEKRELFERENKKRQMREKRVGEIVRGVMRPSLVTNPSTLMDDHGRCKVPEASLETLRQLPHSKLGFGQSNKAMPTKKQEEIN
jgi:hypothetical protein